MMQMTKQEIKKQEYTFKNLNKFIERYRDLIKCRKKDLMEGIPEEIKEIMNKRQFYIDDEILNKLKEHENYKFLSEKKKDDRTELAMIYTICTTQIYENLIMELLKNFNCESYKTGSSFNYDYNKANSKEDLTLKSNNNDFKIELQRSNFMTKNDSFELKYHKINKDVLNYIVDDKTGELSLLIIHFDKDKNKIHHKYDAKYSDYLKNSHKKGYYINNIYLNQFISFDALLEKFDDFNDVYDYVFV